MTTQAISPDTAGRDGGKNAFYSGSFTSNGNAAVGTLGVKPRYVKVFNQTDTITWEWSEGMAATNAFKTTSSALAVDTGTAILDNGDGTFTISSGAAGTSKALTWIAFC